MELGGDAPPEVGVAPHHTSLRPSVSALTETGRALEGGQGPPRCHLMVRFPRLLLCHCGTFVSTNEFGPRYKVLLTLGRWVPVHPDRGEVGKWLVWSGMDDGVRLQL